MKSIRLGVFAAFGLASALVAADPPPQDIERAKQAARENRLLPEHEAFYWKALHETHALLMPLLDTCALQDCYGAGMSNTYVMRVQADGTIGEMFIEPSNRFTKCVADGLKAQGHMRTLPPSDGYWIEWAASGVMRVPEGCREELTPATWDTLKWWLFIADMAFPRAAFRVRVVLGFLAIAPFILALAAWKILRPDDGGRALLLSILGGAGILVLAAVLSFAIGSLTKEAKDDNYENVLVTLLFAFPLLTALPFALRGLRRPRLPRGSRLRLPTAGPVRRLVGVALLLAALLPAIGMAWFAAHENVHRICPTCVKPYKFGWLSLRLWR